MSIPDEFPREQDILPDHCRDFCIELLDLFHDTENSFIATVERLAPTTISLNGITLSTRYLNDTVRSRLTNLPRQIDIDDTVTIDVALEQHPDGSVILQQLSMQHDDGGNMLVLSRLENGVSSIVDYDNDGAERRVLAPETALRNTLFGMMFGGEVPDELTVENWQHIITHLQQIAPVSERSLVLDKLLDTGKTTVRIINAERLDESVHAIEVTVLNEVVGDATARDKMHGIRVAVTEFGTRAKIIPHVDLIRTRLAMFSHDNLEYATAWNALTGDNNTMPWFPTEKDIAILETALEQLIASYRQDKTA